MSPPGCCRTTALTRSRAAAGVRRFADTDEINMVIVGCGAGGSVLAQRLARAGWKVAALERGAVLGPRSDSVSDEAGFASPPVLDRADGSSTAPTRCRWAPTTRAGVSAARWCASTRATPPGSTPSDFTTYTADGVGADWPLSYADLSRTSRRHRAGTPRRGGAVAVGRPARLPAPAASGRRERRDLPARRGQARDHRQGRPGRDRQRPVRQPAALHLPRLLPAGLQGQRQGVAADHAHPRRARRAAPRSAPTRWSPRW